MSSPAKQARLFVKQIGDPTGVLTMLDIERDNGHKPISDVGSPRIGTLPWPPLLYAPAGIATHQSPRRPPRPARGEPL
jgi:hypothetical protein